MASYFRLLDTFNRGDTTDPGDPPWNQTIHSGFPASHDIASNRLIPAASTGGWCSDYWDEGSPFAADQACEITIPTSFTGGAFRVCMRMVNPGVDATLTGYEFETDGGNSYIVRVDPTYARTTIHVTGVGFSAGYRMRCECKGNKLSMYRDTGGGFVHIGSVYDNTTGFDRAGYIGLMCAGVTGATFDNFWAGDLGGPFFPQLQVLDDFDRSNGDPGSNWSTAFVASASKPLIDTNVLKSGTGTTANSGMYWNVEEAQDGEAYFTIPTLPSPATSNMYLTFRAKDVARTGVPPNSSGWSGYQVHYADTFVILRKYDGSSATTLYTSTPLLFVAGDSLGASFVGNKITVYYKFAADDKWTQLAIVTDSTYLDSGYLGIEFDEGTCRVNNFGGGKHPALTSYAAAVVALSPTSYWRFSGASFADIGSARRRLFPYGIPLGTPSIIPSELGAANSAVAFDGNDALQAADAAIYNFQKTSPDWSINFWMKYTSSTFSSGFQRLFEKRDGAADVRGYTSYGFNAGDIAFDADPGAGTVEGLSADTNLVQDTVYMLTYTYEASTGTVSIYKNGAFVGSKTNFTFEADLFHHNSEKFTIGADSTPTSNFFVGMIDDFAVWEGTLLTSGQIASLYTVGTTVAETAYIIQPPFVRV